MWGGAESGSAHILGNGYTFRASAVTIVSASANDGGISANLERLLLPVNAHTLLYAEHSPGAADFRALPEKAVVVKASLSAVISLRATPLVKTGD